MIQKIFSLKNKILAVLLIVLVSAIIYIISIDKYNQDFFLKTIENKLNLEINNKGSYNINFFPKFHLIQKDLEIFKKFNNYSIVSRNIDIDIVKKYFNWNKTFFQINSLSTVVKGITIRNIKVNGFDKNSETLKLTTPVSPILLEFKIKWVRLIKDLQVASLSNPISEISFHLKSSCLTCERSLDWQINAIPASPIRS